MNRYKLKLKRLDFISPVDEPAQETAKVLLIKRRAVDGFARVAKVSDELGLVFCWALTTKGADGADYYDLHGDNVLEQDLVKVAAEFMQGGAATDEMHNSEPDGRVVFAMPMTAEIAKAFGVETKTMGLMVALKPSAEVLAKFKSGEYTGVSIAGYGERIQARKRRVLKSTVLTSEDAGHAHSLDLDAPLDGWSGALSTSYQNSTGEQGGHSHAWAFDPATGAISIAADGGHSHTCSAVVPAEVIAAAAAQEVDEMECAPVDDTDEESPSTSITVIAARRKSTRKGATNEPALTSPEPTMTPEELAAENADLKQKLADLQAQLDASATKAEMTDAQKAHYGKLDAKDAKAFLGKSASERDGEIAKALAADEVLVEFNGQSYRKSAGPAVIELAKAAKAQAEQLAKRDEEIEKADIRKQAADCLGGVAGTDEIHDYIVKSIRKGGGDVTKALETLKSVQAFTVEARKAKGFNPGTEPVGEEPLAKFNAAHAAFAKSINKPMPQAFEAFVSTPEGAQLYADATSVH